VPPVAVKAVDGYTAPVLMDPVGSEDEVVVTARCKPPPLDEQLLSTKSRAIAAIIPKKLNTLPRLNRESLNIAAILFRQMGFRGREEKTGLKPNPEPRNVGND